MRGVPGISLLCKPHTTCIPRGARGGETLRWRRRVVIAPLRRATLHTNQTLQISEADVNSLLLLLAYLACMPPRYNPPSAQLSHIAYTTTRDKSNEWNEKLYYISWWPLFYVRLNFIYIVNLYSQMSQWIFLYALAESLSGKYFIFIVKILIEFLYFFPFIIFFCSVSSRNHPKIRNKIQHHQQQLLRVLSAVEAFNAPSQPCIRSKIQGDYGKQCGWTKKIKKARQKSISCATVYSTLTLLYPDGSSAALDSSLCFTSSGNIYIYIVVELKIIKHVENHRYPFYYIFVRSHCHFLVFFFSPIFELNWTCECLLRWQEMFYFWRNKS